jgi:hypothetical protein
LGPFRHPWRRFGHNPAGFGSRRGLHSGCGLIYSLGVSRNGRRRPPRPRIEPPTTATPEEAAAIAAGLERFLAETAPAPTLREPARGWQRAALVEGVSAKRRAFPPEPGSGIPLD